MSVKPELYDVIRKPIVTEKATMASETGAVVFEVAIESNKPQIKEAVESLFGVKVKAVNNSQVSPRWISPQSEYVCHLGTHIKRPPPI